jgi:hypothetical protein
MHPYPLLPQFASSRSLLPGRNAGSRGGDGYVVITLLNLGETLSAKVVEQAEEIQRLRDEINRRKGEQGKPKIKANKGALALSSEKGTLVAAQSPSQSQQAGPGED